VAQDQPITPLSPQVRGVRQILNWDAAGFHHGTYSLHASMPAEILLWMQKS
jgi:hypothetical protein